MDLDEYLTAIRHFGDELNRQERAFELYLANLKGRSEIAESCVNFRRSVATEAELASVVNHVEMGYFRAADADQEKAWWLFFFEVLYAAANVELEKSCSPYSRHQPLFIGSPGLFEAIRRRGSNGAYDFELIDDSAIVCIEESDIYQVEMGFSKLVPQLHPGIPAWTRTAFPGCPLFLRLNPWEFHKERPLLPLQKVTLATANPRWMETLALFPNTKTFAAYGLENCSVEENRQQAVDYSVHNIRKLEVVAQRRDSNYLSMMIEELPRQDDPNGLMVSHCIHLDTRAPAGTPMADAKLQHLDLAINVYRGDDRAARMSGTLQNGRVQDATYRVHLMRIEDIPFPALFSFSEMFLKSRHLLAEWISELFPHGA
jgi:hypothetical protein